MLRQLCVVAGLGALCALGALFGDRVANAACEAKCKEVEFYHKKQYAGDMTGTHWKINNGKCIRFHWTNAPEGDYSGIMGTMKKGLRIIANNCSHQCFANGDVPAELSCTNFTLDNGEENITCYNECRDTPPGPPGM